MLLNFALLRPRCAQNTFPNGPTLRPSLMINPADLRLEGALALLEHDRSACLPDAAESATAFLQSVIDSLCEMSLTDALTGLANRRHFRTVLTREIDVVARSGDSALLLMLDIDHFKQINDTHGHPVGDQVIQAVARCLSNCVRPMDTVARYGGEEFAVILPCCQPLYGKIVAERIRQSVAALRIPASEALGLSVTISIGGAFAPKWSRSSATQWIDLADAQLYCAKTEGRNRVKMDAEQEISVSAEEKSLLFGHLNQSDAAWLETHNNETPAKTSTAMQ